MRFIHVADLHASRERLPQTLSVLKTLTERAKVGDIDFIIFAGDFYDSTITATKSSGFSDILEAKRELEKYTWLYFIYGTASHEPSGCLDAFKSEKTLVIDSMLDILHPLEEETVRIICIPEPRRSNYISTSMSETDKLINDDIERFIKDYKKLQRRDYTIVVYHGEVKGAVYQNGVSASSPTAIPKKLLQSLNADYYALGHIHMPQQVFENAWYSGSACPKNYGEPHDGCYHLVTVKDDKTEVERVSFGLPIYQTLHASLNFLDEPYEMLNDQDLKNSHVRFIFDCSKEQKKSINLKTYADTLKKEIGCLSVKLEPTIIESETTERSEVAKHKSIVDKMAEYAKEKALIIPKYAKELLKNIEDNTLAKLAYPQHSFELLSLSLRGAIGIRDGQHKDDFELDFEHMEDGVVCLAGDCGAGKSTLLENCHPYPCMLTRDGTLKEHFCLKDSHRILIYKDENDLFYKISMLIDGKTASGKVSYYVETSKDRESWKSVSDVDGSLETYKKWVNETFGSIDVFLRTAFFAKEKTKEATDISDTTKGERMELLSKLAGTDHLKEVSNIAKKLRQEVEKSADKIETEIDSYSHYEDSIKENKEDITKWTHELKGQKKTVSDLEKKVSELQIKDAEYQKVKAIADMNKTLYSRYKKDFDEKSKYLNELESCVDNKDVYDNIAKCKIELEKDTSRMSEINLLLDKNRKLLKELEKEISVLKDKQTEFVREMDKLYFRINELDGQICDTTDVCPTCGQPLSEHKKEELEEHNRKCKAESEALDKERYRLDKECSELITKPLKEKCTQENNLENEITDLEVELKILKDNCDENNSYINKYSQLYTGFTYDEIIAETKVIRAEVDKLKSDMASIDSSESLKDVSEELSDTEESLKREQNRLAELNASIKAAENENKKYAKALESVADKKAEVLDLKDKITAYNFIEDAFSNNGIPAIELRESAPEIADIANKILEDSYGNKFEIRFGNTSELKTKRKANEDFNIIVTDTENFDEKTIDLVSSGERIWIKQALFYAFSIVQMNRTGFNFRTRLIDESDGSLDGGLRPKYLKMVEAAHKQADSRLTILISHSQEIKDIAQQLIEI